MTEVDRVAPDEKRCQGCEDAPIGQHTGPHDWERVAPEELVERHCRTCKCGQPKKTYPHRSGRGLAVVPQQFRLLAPAGSLSASVPGATIRGAEEPIAKEAPMPPRTPPEQRFWSKVDRAAGPDACWPWVGGFGPSGYGLFWTYKRHVAAHRWAYEELIGPIPDGLQLDHLCRNRACCNPAHLEPVTQRENIMRGEGIAAQRARQTHCKRGHEFTSESHVFEGGRRRRRCQVCQPRRNGRAW